MTKKIHVALVDDHSLFRDGVRQTLAKAGDIEIVAEGASAAEAISIAANLAPDVMLLDLCMPGGGLAATAEIVKANPNIKILLLTVSEREEDVSAAMDFGALGYVLKGIGGPDLVQTVRMVSTGVPYITPTLAAGMLRKLRRPDPPAAKQAAYDRLTVREEQILEHLAEGMTNYEIADKLELREKTVKHYMTIIMQKLRVRNRTEAVLKHQRIRR